MKYDIHEWRPNSIGIVCELESIWGNDLQSTEQPHVLRDVPRSCTVDLNCGTGSHQVFSQVHDTPIERHQR